MRDSDYLIDTNEEFGDLDINLDEATCAQRNHLKKQKLMARRRVEEIIAEKSYRDKYSDPFEEYDL